MQDFIHTPFLPSSSLVSCKCTDWKQCECAIKPKDLQDVALPLRWRHDLDTNPDGVLYINHLTYFYPRFCQCVTTILVSYFIAICLGGVLLSIGLVDIREVGVQVLRIGLALVSVISAVFAVIQWSECMKIFNAHN